MILQTTGSESVICTRSRPAVSATPWASASGTIPAGSPSAPMSLTWFASISSLMGDRLLLLLSLLIGCFSTHFKKIPRTACSQVTELADFKGVGADTQAQKVLQSLCFLRHLADFGYPACRSRKIRLNRVRFCLIDTPPLRDPDARQTPPGRASPGPHRSGFARPRNRLPFPDHPPPGGRECAE